jgi:hypothetical protein
LTTSLIATPAPSKAWGSRPTVSNQLNTCASASQCWHVLQRGKHMSQYSTFRLGANDATKEPMFLGLSVNVSRYDQQKYRLFEKLIEKQLFLLAP